MRIFHGFDNLPHFKSPMVTVGSYDGVHAGHRVILGRIVDAAHAANAESVVVTFSPHPRTVINDGLPEIHLLNSLKEKALLLEELGIDNLIIAPFTKEFSRVSSHNFVKDYLVGRIGVSTLFVGYNHHFGYNKEGNFDYLYRLRDEFQFTICEVPRQEVDNDKVSSTVVRKLITEGRMSQAAHYLTRPYFIICQCDVSGNIILDEPNKLLPAHGTYNVEVVTPETSAVCRLIISDGRPFFENAKDIAPFSDFIVKF